MSPSFRVIYSARVVEKLKKLHARAKTLGIEDEFLAALREIDSRLSREPMEFGDPAFTLPFVDLKIRHQIVKPLVVYWGVNETESLVFLKSFELF